jgi:hypothetical protein
MTPPAPAFQAPLSALDRGGVVGHTQSQCLGGSNVVAFPNASTPLGMPDGGLRILEQLPAVAAPLEREDQGSADEGLECARARGQPATRGCGGAVHGILTKAGGRHL